MVSAAKRYSTKELSPRTLPDFEKLFEKHPTPGAFGCWCMYHHEPRFGETQNKGQGQLSRVEEAARNRSRKRNLVDEGKSHGILVYSNDEPVGWCQYGTWEELPRFDAYRTRQEASPRSDTMKRWTITCFTVERKYRGTGVASTALRAALGAIGRKGGGLVEAYPIAKRGAYREYLGTVSMFRREGFKIASTLGKNNVIVRRTI